MASRGWQGVTENQIARKVTRGSVRPPPKGARLAQEAPSKYRSVKTEVDGIVFHSAKESRRYAELKLLEKAGDIRALCLQQIWPLWVHTGLSEAPPVAIGSYVSDFSYETDKGDIIEDVKGFKTPLYRWKKKHFEAQYGLEIHEI
jgi:hypothetical protein